MGRGIFQVYLRASWKLGGCSQQSVAPLSTDEWAQDFDTWLTGKQHSSLESSWEDAQDLQDGYVLLTIQHIPNSNLDLLLATSGQKSL